MFLTPVQFASRFQQSSLAQDFLIRFRSFYRAPFRIGFNVFKSFLTHPTPSLRRKFTVARRGFKKETDPIKASSFLVPWVYGIGKETVDGSHRSLPADFGKPIKPEMFQFVFGHFIVPLLTLDVKVSKLYITILIYEPLFCPTPNPPYPPGGGQGEAFLFINQIPLMYKHATNFYSR